MAHSLRIFRMVVGIFSFGFLWLVVRLKAHILTEITNLSISFLNFFIPVDQSNFFKDCADVIDPVESINISHLEVVVCLKDRLA